MSAATEPRLAGVQIVLTAVLAAVAYGVLHNQFTARVCVEYFTIGHPPVFGTTDPTLLGLGWGILGTWWVGLALGVPLAFAARAGSLPAVRPSELFKPIGILLACMGACAALAGTGGLAAARAGAVFLVEPLASDVPASKHHAFVSALWTHLASYGSGLAGGVIVIATVWRRRSRLAPTVDAAQAASGSEGEPGAPAPSVIPISIDRALGLGAQLACGPQLVLLFLAALLGLATLVGDEASIVRARALSGVFAASVVALGVAAWKRQHMVPRVLTVVLALPALWLCLVSLGNLL